MYNTPWQLLSEYDDDSSSDWITPGIGIGIGIDIIFGQKKGNLVTHDMDDDHHKMKP